MIDLGLTTPFPKDLPEEGRGSALPSSTLIQILDRASVFVAALDTQERLLFFNRAAKAQTGYALADLQAKGAFFEKLFPNSDFREQLRRLVAEILKHGQALENLEAEIRTQTGSSRVLLWHFNLFRDALKHPAGIVVMATDITERRQAEAQIHDRELRFRELFGRLTEAVLVFVPKAAGRDFLLRDMNESAESALGRKRHAILGRLAEEALLPWAEDGLPAALAECAISGRSLRLSHTVRDEHGTITAAREHELYRLPSGELVLITESEKAMQRVQLLESHEQLRELTQAVTLTAERERRRLAQELHDHVGQKLAVGKLKLELLHQNTRPNAAESAELGEVVELLSSAIDDVQALTSVLSSQLLLARGLEAALVELAERMLKPKGIDVEFCVLGPIGRLSEDTTHMLYRSARELFYNIVKHARARHVEVVLVPEDEHLSLAVCDDGLGFDALCQARHLSGMGRYGLFSLRESVAYLGGELDIESSVGQGTRVTLHFPLKKATP